MAKPETADKIIKMHDELCRITTSCRADVMRFARGNATAGIRIRATMQDVRSGAKRIRDEIQKIKKARKKEKQNAQVTTS